MSVISERLRSVMHTSLVLTELQHSQMQLRLITVLLSLSMMFDLLDPATFILTVPTSITARVAMLAYSAELVAYSFIALGALLAPYAAMHAFFPNHPARRGITQLACFALLGASLQWMFLAYLSRNLDIEAVTGVWLRTAMGALGYSMVLAVGLNAEHARHYFDCHK